MKLKLDENLPEVLVAELTSLGHDTDNVRIEGLAGRPDEDVWQAAQRVGRLSSPRTSTLPTYDDSNPEPIMA